MHCLLSSSLQQGHLKSQKHVLNNNKKKENSSFGNEPLVPEQDADWYTTLESKAFRHSKWQNIMSHSSSSTQYIAFASLTRPSLWNSSIINTCKQCSHDPDKCKSWRKFSIHLRGRWKEASVIQVTQEGLVYCVTRDLGNDDGAKGTIIC